MQKRLAGDETLLLGHVNLIIIITIIIWLGDTVTMSHSTNSRETYFLSVGMKIKYLLKVLLRMFRLSSEIAAWCAD